MADETIQNLNIDISVDDKASSQIKSLEESIDSLLKKFETLDTKTDSLSKNLGDFGGADKSIDNAASKIDKMTKSAEKFSKTDISGNIGKQLDDVAQGYSKLELLQKSLEKQSEKSQGLVDKGKTIEDKALLNSLLQEYSKLEKVEREYAKQTTKSTPKQTKTAQKPTVSDKDFEAAYNAAKKYDNELSGLEAQAKALAAQMAKMSAEGKNFGTSWENSAKRLNKIQGQIKSIEAEQAKVQLDTSNLNVPDVKLDTKQAENLTRILDKAEQETNKFGESAKKAAVDLNYLTSSYAKLDYLQKELNTSQQKLKELAQGGEGYENKTVRKLIDDINKYQKEINNINSERFKEIDNQIKSVGKNGKKNFKDLGKTAEQSFKKVDKGAKKSTKSTKKFGNGLRNILRTAKQFLIFGAFFTIQRQISDAFGEGTQNLYQYSKAIDGEFASSMDRLATSFLFLKNAVAAAVAPIINFFTPAIESLTDSVANFANKLAELFAALSGQTTFKKAVKSFTEYAEAVDIATNANNNALASFDEINNITTATDAGADELNKNPATMFETAQVGQGINLDSEKFILITSIFENLKRVWNECKETLEILQPVLDILLWDWAAPLIDIGIDWLASAWDGLNKVLRDFSDWCVENPETVKNMADIILALFLGIKTYLLVNKIGTAIQDFGKKLVDWAKNADKAKLAASGLAIAGFAILSSEILKLSQNWSSMNKTEKIIAVLGGLAIAAAAAAAAVGALQSAWSLGVAAVAIVGGIVAIEASISSAQKRAEKNAKIDTKSAFADGGFPITGQAFIARENGPELVGTIGKRTAVVNNDQIVQSVSLGVYNAVVDALSITNDNNSNEQPIIIQIDGREVFRAVRSQNDNFRRRTGTSAF